MSGGRKKETLRRGRSGRPGRLRRRGQRGQVLIEYVFMMVCCIVIGIALAGLFYAFSRYGDDRLDWVSIDYP